MTHYHKEARMGFSRTKRKLTWKRPWSREDVKFLRKYYKYNDTKWIMRQLNRTRYAVRNQAQWWGLHKAKFTRLYLGNQGLTARQALKKAWRK